MTNDEIWNNENPVADVLDIEIPAWIDQDIDCSTVASIVQGGCASGAYMPAVSYHTALDTMGTHGDDVLQYIEDALGEVPTPTAGESWSGLASRYLSTAVEWWASGVMAQLEDFEPEDTDEN